MAVCGIRSGKSIVPPKNNFNSDHKDIVIIHLENK